MTKEGVSLFIESWEKACNFDRELLKLKQPDIPLVQMPEGVMGVVVHSSGIEGLGMYDGSDFLWAHNMKEIKSSFDLLRFPEEFIGCKHLFDFNEGNKK